MSCHEYLSFSAAAPCWRLVGQEVQLCYLRLNRQYITVEPYRVDPLPGDPRGADQR